MCFGQISIFVSSNALGFHQHNTIQYFFVVLVCFFVKTKFLPFFKNLYVISLSSRFVLNEISKHQFQNKQSKISHISFIFNNKEIFFRVEEELLLRRSLGDLETDTVRRGSTSARRSFFRRKKHQRSSSRDSKDISHLTGVSMSWYSDSGTLNEENLLASYQRVERVDCTLKPLDILNFC